MQERHGVVARTSRFGRGSPRRSAIVIAALALAGVASSPKTALADEGGVSFWIPGFFGSLAAAPLVPGWSTTEMYYHTSVSASGNVALAREFQIGRIPF